MLELDPVAFQSTLRFILLLTSRGMGTQLMAVKHPRGQKRGPEDLRNGRRMLRSPKELKENRTSHPQLAKLFQLTQLVRPATVGISATIFSARRKKRG